MSLYIKIDDTCELAAELAIPTDETKTGPTAIAPRERFDRERRVRDSACRLWDMRGFDDRCVSLLEPEPGAIEPGHLLNDEQGLPA